MENIKEIKGLKMICREGTLDDFVVRENDYSKCDFNKEDIWLDAGGNIGVFACKFHDKVSKIISYEPDNTNFRILQENLILNNVKNCIAVNSCLVGNEDDTREFFLNKKKNKGMHSLLVKGGRERLVVKCENIVNVIKKYNVNKIKMDVEGAEYELLKSMDFTNIKEIVLEFHFAVLKDIDKKEKYYEIIDLLKSNFFDVKYRDDLKKGWTTIIKAKK
jgi:FkbM family methyltransferase